MKSMIIYATLFLSVIFCQNSDAENVIFPNYSSTISKLELDLALFDLTVNRLNILNTYPLNYIRSISSDSISNDKIRCWVSVDHSIINGTLEERKARLTEFCKLLFKQYQNRFLMIDTDYVKKPGEVGVPALRMKESNMHIYVHTDDYKSLFLAEWESGSMSYKDDFLTAK